MVAVLGAAWANRDSRSLRGQGGRGVHVSHSG